MSKILIFFGDVPCFVQRRQGAERETKSGNTDDLSQVHPRGGGMRATGTVVEPCGNVVRLANRRWIRYSFNLGTVHDRGEGEVGGGAKRWLEPFSHEAILCPDFRIFGKKLLCDLASLCFNFADFWTEPLSEYLERVLSPRTWKIRPVLII